MGRNPSPVGYVKVNLFLPDYLYQSIVDEQEEINSQPHNIEFSIPEIGIKRIRQKIRIRKRSDSKSSVRVNWAIPGDLYKELLDEQEQIYIKHGVKDKKITKIIYSRLLE